MQALHTRRETLLRRGVTKWLAVAFDFIRMRQTYAAQQGAQVRRAVDSCLLTGGAAFQIIDVKLECSIVVLVALSGHCLLGDCIINSNDL